MPVMEDSKWSNYKHDPYLPAILIICIFIFLMVFFIFDDLIILKILSLFSILFFLIMLLILSRRYVLLRKGIIKYFTIEDIMAQSEDIYLVINEKIHEWNSSIQTVDNSILEKYITGNSPYHYIYNSNKKNKIYIRVQRSYNLCVVVLTGNSWDFAKEIDFFISDIL